jgi:hypothetical protein
MGLDMRSSRRSKFARAIVVAVALSALAVNGTVANAASKTITCYKGAAVKKVTGATPKCAVGWTTKKPVVKKPVVKKPVVKKPAVKPTVKPAIKAAVVAFSGTYKGKIAMVWSASDVQATSVTGSGTGNIAGLSALTGTGSSAPASQCDSINGSGVLSGGGNTLKVSFDTSSKGCAEDSAAPTTVNITGNAVIGGGTGKFANATGTLKVTGSFSIKSTEAGTNDTSALTLTLTGNINTK